jgi:hypothetical protein
VIRAFPLCLGLFLSLITLHVALSGENKEDVTMETDVHKIEDVRATLDSKIMAIPGVVSVATGLAKDGSPCLKIGTSVPVEQVRGLLPRELAGIPVELENIGEIQAQ